MKEREGSVPRWRLVLAIAAAMVFAGCTSGSDELSREEKHEQIMTKAREVAQDIDTPEEARAAGYVPDKHCIPGMGVHWIHKPGQPDSHVDTELDIENPEVVLFLPDDADLSDTSGDRFLAIEYLVVTEGTEMNSTETKPDLMGVPFDGPMAGHSPQMPWHADFHIYLAEGYESGPDFPAEQPEKIKCPEGTTPPMEGDSEPDQQLAEVRKATTGYQDVSKAQADGYVQFSVHVPGMGLHYLHDSAFNADGTSALDRSLDRTDPEVVLYVEEDGEHNLVSVEYAVPVKDGETSPPSQAVSLFDDADASDWHKHPSRHELGLGSGWTVHAECHYRGGLGVWLAEDPNGTYAQLTPDGQIGTWSGSVAPDQCPEEAGGEDLPPLLLVHEKWWTLHAWVWQENPEGVFHPTNPTID